MTNGMGIGKPQRLQDFTMSSKRQDSALCNAFETTHYLDVDLHSPTDSSEDSVEVKVFPISPRNKRKCSEPRRVHETFLPPLKKRVYVKSETPETPPFRPWKPDDSDNFVEPQPLPLIKKKEEGPRVPPLHPDNFGAAAAEMMLNSVPFAYERKEQRNYKNMTRERRIEANARERTRVHTISAAFETLRHSVPSYSHNQKLSKLSVLRIACSYIMTLGALLDDSETLPECVNNVSQTIQKEGKLRKKKDESD